MGSLGFPELLLIFVVALIVFGPRKLPEIGRTLGKALGEFRKATDDLKNTIEREVRADELKEIAATTVQAVSSAEPAAAPAMTIDPASAPAMTVDPASAPAITVDPASAPADNTAAAPATTVASAENPTGSTPRVN